MTTDQTINRTIESAEIDRVLAEAVRTGAVSHVAAIVADRDGILYEGGSGMRVAGGSNDLVGTSTQFRIMSMTKLMCTAAALQSPCCVAASWTAPASWRSRPLMRRSGTRSAIWTFRPRS